LDWRSLWLGLERGGRFTLPLGLAILVILIMPASNKVILKKKAGRPATGNDPVPRYPTMPNDFLAKVDAWAAKQDDELGRSEAIRRLVEIGLQGEGK